MKHEADYTFLRCLGIKCTVGPRRQRLFAERKEETLFELLFLIMLTH